ncbi:MAG TPA: CAP domain-containing protein [Patescibacteria group bacterium]|nr:CAP domain-containing protein [Patescibacteria group bacterium]
MVLVSKSKRPTTIRTKRRQGHHHKRDERYLRPYWPYIPLLLIVAVGLVFSNLWGVAQKGVLGYATEMSTTNLLNGTNNQRTAASLGSLALNSKLNQAAQAKANDMAARDYWSHNTPDGATPWTFFASAGYNYQTAGENLAYGFDSSDNTITAWMNSPEHKANILGNYTEVGFGVANSSNYQGTGPETIVVAMYGTPQPTAAAPAPAATKPKAATPAPTQTPVPVAETPQAASPTETTPAASKPKETTTTAATGVKKDTKTVTAQNVSRIQLLTNGQAAWSTFVVTMFATVCIGVFILRHGLFWHRTLVKGEAFFIHHKVLDGALIAIAVIGFVLTRTAGVIH